MLFFKHLTMTKGNETAQLNRWMLDLINIMPSFFPNVSVSIWIMISVPLSTTSNNYLCTPKVNKNFTNFKGMQNKLRLQNVFEI